MRQLTISFRDLARTKLREGRRVGSVTCQSAPGVHSHNVYSCPSKTSLMELRQMMYVDKSGNGGSTWSSRSKHACLREAGMKLCFPHQNAATSLVYMKFVATQSSPTIEISDKSGDIF